MGKMDTLDNRHEDIAKQAFPNMVIFLIALLAFWLVFAFKALTRIDGFIDPDIMNFVDIARNIADGRGIAQSTLGFNQPRFEVGDETPVPLISQPPLYPLIVALLYIAGIPAPSAAISVSIICYGLILILVYKISSELFDPRTAILSVILYLLYDPLYWLSSTGYSELTGLFFIFLSLWLLIKIHRAGENPTRLLVISGLTTGLAFATRYALLSFVAVGVFFILFDSKAKFRDLTIYLLSFMVPAAFVWGRNWYLIGSLMPSPNPSTSSFLENLENTFKAIAGTYLPINVQLIVQAALLVIMGIVIIGILAARRQLASSIWDVFVYHGRYILTLWVVIYLPFLIFQRTRTHFDDIDERLVVPATLVIIIFVAAFIVKSFVLKRDHMAYFACAVMTFLVIREIWVVVQSPVYNMTTRISESELLSWIERNTDENDLIIGDDIVYVPFYFDRNIAVSFSPYPYSDYLEYSHLMQYSQNLCNAYDSIYLLVRSFWANNEEGWNDKFGPFITDLMTEGVQKYPNIQLLHKLNDGTVFILECD